VLAHPSSTLEELYLAARLAEGLGSSNVDHRLRQRDFSDQAADALAPGLGLAIAEVEQLDALLVVGSNLRHELPILAHRVRKGALRGTRVSFINPARFEYLFPLAQYRVAAGGQLGAELAGVLRAAVSLAGAAMPAEAQALIGALRFGAAEPSSEQRALAESLRSGRCAIWLGALSIRASDYAAQRILSRALARVTGATLGELAEGGNAAGACLAGVLPHRGIAGSSRASVGRNAREMLERALPGYLLLHTEPWADAVLPGALETLAGAGVVAVTPYASESMRRVARVLLPAGTFAETSGTYVNLEGRWQSYGGAARPLGEARPAWKILRVLGNELDLPRFDYQSSEQVRDELAARLQAAGAAPAAAGAAPAAVAAPPASELDATARLPALAMARDEALIDLPMYQIDAIVRRAFSLQSTRDGQAVLQRYGSGGV
jgi:NADH-quinone oxidoreductase subunit G